MGDDGWSPRDLAVKFNRRGVVHAMTTLLLGRVKIMQIRWNPSRLAVFYAGDGGEIAQIQIDFGGVAAQPR
jgi:hypothetical protein